jgi:hypothetical protein
MRAVLSKAPLGLWDQLRQVLIAPLALLLATLLTACGGAGGSAGSSAVAAPASCTASTCGTALLTLTDAPGDFLTYQVSLTSLQLKKADGTTVEALPAAVSVDLAQLITLSEVVTSGQLPTGEYVGATVTVDYTGAKIIVDDGTTAGLQLSSVDANGQALGKLALAVQLDTKHELEIHSGIPSNLSFDFNLLASNTVDTSLKTVTVSPVLVASIVPPAHKDMHARGSVVSVDTANSSYTIDVHPFHDSDSTSKGQLVVHVTGTTTYEINGTPFTGAAGLTQLATLGVGTPTEAHGAIGTDGAFTATQVLAGTSVHSSTMDGVDGTVVARSGRTLTVLAGDMEHHEGGNTFVGTNVTVTLADTTAVTVEGQGSSATTHTIGEISVGTRIHATGVATKDSGGKITVDASTGRVRIGPSVIGGTVVSMSPGSVTLALTSINGRDVGLLHFAGTGSPTGQDSNPALYVLSTGMMDLTALKAGSPVRFVGTVSPFGSAPPDFVALQSDLGVSHDLLTGTFLGIDWGHHGTTAPFATADAAHLVLDLSNPAIGEHHVILMGDHRVDLKTLAGNPTIVPDTTATSALFSIVHAKSDRVDNRQAFADFYSLLASSLNGATVAFALAADGSYDATTNTFTAAHLVIRVND